MITRGDAMLIMQEIEQKLSDAGFVVIRDDELKALQQLCDRQTEEIRALELRINRLMQ